jgi:hypothetical protein
MRSKNSSRYKILRGTLLAGSILSFIPAFALVRSNAAADSSTSTGAQPAQSQTQTSPSSQPSSRQPSAQSQTPSQSLPRTTQPRVRTRAS